jgi:acyl-CoA thioester hydrolase
MGATAFTLPVRVYYEDTDAAGVVYHANYLKFMERARTEWLAQLGFPLAELEAAHGIVFVVTHVDIAFRAPARLGDLLSVGVRLSDCGRASLVAVQDIHRDDESIVAAHVTLACVSRPAFRPVRIPSPLLEMLN